MAIIIYGRLIYGGYHQLERWPTRHHNRGDYPAFLSILWEMVTGVSADGVDWSTQIKAVQNPKADQDQGQSRMRWTDLRMFSAEAAAELDAIRQNFTD